ncbi:MAG: hypothetical protein J6P02_01640 [Lachnospiraceae bacterium]|nr:hypothetical protein [Lachnospiraceae bacterium]
MHGMVDITTAEMEKEQTNKISFLHRNWNPKKVFYVAMIVIVAIIAIILVDLINKNTRSDESGTDNYLTSDISVKLNDDEKIDKFIRDYFLARTDLNYSKIFSAFGRDYYKEEREESADTFKKTIDNIRYERIFIKSYDNIKIYVANGFDEDEKICIVTYDMSFGFTTDKAPTIILFYLEEYGDTYIIKENLDVGTSKYVVDVVNTKIVKDLYNETYAQLNRVLNSNESLKLAYNSFRQSEMNMKSSLGSLHKKEIIEKITANKIDPVKDADEIYKEIIEKKEDETRYNVLNEYLDRVIASLSIVQRAY